MPEPANIPTPPAWDFTSEGLRIHVERLAPSAYGDLVYALAKEMKDGKGSTWKTKK